MLDDFAHEMETTESKMDNVMKKMAKVLHMSNGKYQYAEFSSVLTPQVFFLVSSNLWMPTCCICGVGKEAE